MELPMLYYNSNYNINIKYLEPSIKWDYVPNMK